LVSAYGTMRVVYTAWKAAFLTISVLATNRFVDSAVFNGTPFSIGSIITLIVTLFILMFLFAGRHSILPSRN
jgi:hypothetical protein